MVYDLSVKINNNLIRNNILPILDFRKIIRISVESTLWIFSSIIASFIIYDGLILTDNYNEVLFLGILGSVAYFLFNIIFAVYKIQLMKASFEETLRISLSILFTTLTLYTIRISFDFPNFTDRL